MTKKDIAAINDVLAHWERMLELSVQDIIDEKEAPHAINCALCRIYLLPNQHCVGCPIMRATGYERCQHTPYYSAQKLYMEIANGFHKRLSLFRKAVRREIKFIESLLPK